MEFICKDICKYNLNQFKLLDFSHDKFDGLMSKQQADLIRVKYFDRIENGAIILPKIFKKDDTGIVPDEII